MPLTYLDSSALVKRYMDEAGSAWVTRLCASEPVAISIITLPEIASALGRRTREGALAAGQGHTLFRLFLKDAPTFLIIGLNQAVALRSAAMLLTAAPPVRLRSLDAVHLASAQWTFALARRRGVATGAFVTADRALVQAALWAGLATMNPEDHLH